MFCSGAGQDSRAGSSFQDCSWAGSRDRRAGASEWHWPTEHLDCSRLEPQFQKCSFGHLVVGADAAAAAGAAGAAAAAAGAAGDGGAAAAAIELASVSDTVETAVAAVAAALAVAAAVAAGAEAFVVAAAGAVVAAVPNPELEPCRSHYPGR